MSTKPLDDVLNRWFLDGDFRQQLRLNPEQVLADYQLTPLQRARFYRALGRQQRLQQIAFQRPPIPGSSFSLN